MNQDLNKKCATTKCCAITKSGALCAIALGSNLGDSLKTLEESIQVLNNKPNVKLLFQSSWYKTKPIGPPQPDYINGCVIIQTSLKPKVLLRTLLDIEQKFGRVRKERWGARTLDLDIILYEELILNCPDLEIPHPRMRERAFVIIPLAEICPDWIDPITKLSVIELKQKSFAEDNSVIKLNS